MRVTESISTFRIRFQRGREKNKTKENKKKPKKNKQSVSENPRRHHRRPLDRFGDVTFFCLFLIKAHISGHIIDRRQPEDNGKRWCHFFLLEKEILMKSHIENKKKKLLYLLQRCQVDVERQFRLQFVRKDAQRRARIASALDPTSGTHTHIRQLRIHRQSVTTATNSVIRRRFPFPSRC